VSAEDELSPTFQNDSGSSNVVNLRTQIPFDNSNWVFRTKLPIVTAAPALSVTGAGDLALWDLAVIDAHYDQWLVGGTVRIPTARDSLGTNKYSVGPSVGYVIRTTTSTLGFFFNAFFSVVGPSQYPGVAKLQVAPTVKFDLANGWSVGPSTMQYTYDLIRNRWTAVPLGIRIGKKPLWAKSFDAYVEIEKNLADTRDTPGWTFRFLLRSTLKGPASPSSDEDDDQ
jgi:hypothetical protein